MESVVPDASQARGRHRPIPQPQPEGLRQLTGRAARAGGWTLAGRVSVALAAFGSSALATRMLTPAGMAAYAIGASVATVGGLIGGLGLSQVVVQFAASELAFGRRRAAGQVVWRCVALGFLGLVGFGALFALFGDHLTGDSLGLLAGGAPGGVQVALPAAVVAALLVGSGGQTLVGECHRGLGDARSASVFGGCVGSVLLMGALFGLWEAGRRHLGATDLLWIATVTSAVSVAAGFAVLAPRLWRLRSPSPAESRADDAPAPETPVAEAAPSVGRLFSVSLPWLVSLMLYSAFTQADLWVLGATRHGEEVAAYAVASRVATLVAMPTLVVSPALLPMIAELFATKRRAPLFRLLRLGAAVATAPAAAATLLFAVRGGPLLGLVFGPTYRSGGLALTILAAGNTIAAWSGQAGAVLANCGRHRLMLVTSTLTATATLTAIVLVVPAGGPTAAASLAAGGLTVQSLALVLLARITGGGWTCAVWSPRGRTGHQSAPGRGVVTGSGRRAGPWSIGRPLDRRPPGWPKRRWPWPHPLTRRLRLARARRRTS
ncbi:lipopolysaccharide biosynthesis protein [Frankia sp. AgB1.9]|uniref:lipopolysaccharide biosynthesis protein n=1 Tax=unclassified Frankia TaxID=2632575 RepID=UPI00193459B8|nr:MULTISPECIES: lipopolysaccharide biosynthesis protein [unclassified Frankia]MBL7553460.1 lipopolysaccharide biosynthesis protein [Frankia sp. AgB1.9]